MDHKSDVRHISYTLKWIMILYADKHIEKE